MIVTLLTDFGQQDHFVAAMKGEILSRTAGVTIVDITHQVPRHDIQSAAFLLLAVHRSFPRGTIHVVVVDPGVGSARRPIVAALGGHTFVGPDNGCFSYLLEVCEPGDVREIRHPELLPEGKSTTFHGRDVFAPTAAAIAVGIEREAIGPLVGDPVRPYTLSNEASAGGTLRGRILHVDHFGNCITSFTRPELEGSHEPFHIHTARGTTIPTLRSFYGSGDDNAPFLIWGSAGFLEIAVQGGSAASSLGLSPGSEVWAGRGPRVAGGAIPH